MEIKLNFKFWVGIIGDVATFILVLMPAYFTFPKIKREQSVGTVLCLPFAFTWLNAVAFVFYAANRKNWIVTGINGFAFIVETFYCGVYLWYSTGWRRTLAWVMGVLQVLFLTGMLILQFTVFKDGKHAHARDNVYGIAGAITAFLMYASTMNQAVCAFSTHDVAGLELAWGFFANAAIWTLYSSLSKRDLYLLIANSFGLAFTIFQCAVWYKFRNHQPQGPQAPPP